VTIRASDEWYDEHQLCGKSQYAIGKASRLEHGHQNVYGTPGGDCQGTLRKSGRVRAAAASSGQRQAASVRSLEL